MPEPYESPQPPPSLPVQWFHHANPDETPCAAKVLGNVNEVGVKLMVIPLRGPARTITGVRHLRDPFFKTCGEDFRNSRGAWDFIPGLVIATNMAEDKKQILALHEQGKKATEIAEELGENWSYQKVNAFLRKHDLLGEPGKKAS